MLDEIILLETYCSYHDIELSFIESLETFGLLTVRYEENKRFIIREEIMRSLEKFSRMYYDLNINVPGIDALSHLLEKIKDLQQETENLKARLRIYGRTSREKDGYEKIIPVQLHAGICHACIPAICTRSPSVFKNGGFI